MKFENTLDIMGNQGYTIDTSENFDEKDNLNRLSFFLVLDNYFFAIVCRFLCGFKSKAFAKISSGMKKPLTYGTNARPRLGFDLHRLFLKPTCSFDDRACLFC